jgi:lipid-A-disaccharide synthase
MSDPQIFISAGEATGEQYGAMLLSVLQQRLTAQNRGATFYGMGGQRMADAGLERIVRSEDMAVMGITEVIHHLPRIYREFRKLKRSIRERRPSVAVLIDFPDIHFKLAEELHRLGVPVIFFVSPQLWAWKKQRIKLVQKYVDKMLVIFPFEEKFYRDRGVEAEFVGHPLADRPLPDMSREYFAMCNYLRKDHTWIALLPGSRAKEIRDNLHEILAAARLLVQRSAASNPSQEFDFVLPLSPTLTSAQRKAVFEVITEEGKGLLIRTTDDAAGALFHARASIVASGTATVEAALMGNPFVVVYRVSPLTYAIAKRVVTVPHVAMANLIAGKRMVPELIQSDFTAANIVQHLEPLLPDGPPRESMKQELQRMRGQLSTKPAGHGDSNGAIDRVATITLESIGLPSVIAQSVQS